MVGAKLPYILFYWQQIGLLETLIKFEIEHNISENQGENMVNLRLNDGKFLNIKPIDKRQELIVNGLLKSDIEKYIAEKISTKDLSSRNSIYDYIAGKYSTKKINDFDRLVENSVDPTTEELLRFYNQPTKLMDVIADPLLDELLNNDMEHLASLNNKRVRLSEYMTHLLYNEIAMAHNKFINELEYGNDSAKIFLDENYVIRNLLGKHEHAKIQGSNAGSIVDYVNSFSPVDEILKSSKISMTGKGGIPSKVALI